jgi:hypothetical protein
MKLKKEKIGLQGRDFFTFNLDCPYGIIIDLHFRIRMNCMDNLLVSSQINYESFELYPVDEE